MRETSAVGIKINVRSELSSVRLDQSKRVDADLGSPRIRRRTQTVSST